MCTLLTQNICLMCHTQELWLYGNNIGDAGLTALAKAAESGALPKLESLGLSSNSIGDVGVTALATAGRWTSCRCAGAPVPCNHALRLGMCTLLTQNICLVCHTQVLKLYDNNIGDVGLQAFADALGKGALPALEELGLASNQIGDAGISYLAVAVGNGALDKLTRLRLDSNQIGDAGLQALADALGKGALAPGAEVHLQRNNATEIGKQALRDAAKARGLRVYL